MAADASKIPLTGGEWIPFLNLLSLDVKGIDHPIYAHDIPSFENASRIATALGVELRSDADDKLPTIFERRLTVPPMISIESATWIRSRRTLFLETDIFDERGLNRFMTLAAVPSEEEALVALVKMKLPLKLTVDDSKSMLEIIAEMYVLGKTEKEISNETGYDAHTVKRNVDAFKRYVSHRLDEVKRKSDKPPHKGG